MYYYHMVLFLISRWVMTAFCIVSGFILILSLYDLLLGGEKWGATWYTPLVGVGFIAIGLAARKFVIWLWEQMKRQQG